MITPVHQIQDLLEVHILCTSYHESSQISIFYELKLVSAKWHLSFSAQKTEFVLVEPADNRVWNRGEERFPLQATFFRSQLQDTDLLIDI